MCPSFSIFILIPEHCSACIYIYIYELFSDCMNEQSKLLALISDLINYGIHTFHGKKIWRTLQHYTIEYWIFQHNYIVIILRGKRLIKYLSQINVYMKGILMLTMWILINMVENLINFYLKKNKLKLYISRHSVLI